MRLKFLLIGLVSLASLMSCSSSKDDEASQNLTMDLSSSSSALLIPAPTYSCEEIAKGSLVGTGAISKSYFRLPSPNITWKGDTSLSEIRLVLLSFKIDTAPMKGFECTLSGASLGILFYKTATDANGIVTVTTWDQKLGFDAAVNVSTTKDLTSTTNGFKKCDIICGGVSVPTGTGRFTVKGRWELFGVQRKYATAAKDDFEEFPLKINGDFAVQNPLN